MITIHGEVPSGKNSMGTGINKATGKRMRFYKPAVKKYKDATIYEYTMGFKAFREMARGKPKPLLVEFKIYRATNRRFDFVNVIQIVLDQMVAYGWIDDDNANEIRPAFAEYEVDKKNPRVEIKLKEAVK